MHVGCPKARMGLQRRFFPEAQQNVYHFFDGTHPLHQQNYMPLQAVVKHSLLKTLWMPSLLDRVVIATFRRDKSGK